MVILADLQEKVAKVDRALAKWREMKFRVKMEKKRYAALTGSFERKWLDSSAKGSLAHAPPEGVTRQDEPLSEFEKNLENRKQLMIKEINYDLKKLNETEDKLRTVSEIMTAFSQKVVEQGTSTEQSSRSLTSRPDGRRQPEQPEAGQQGAAPRQRVQRELRQVLVHPLHDPLRHPPATPHR